MSKALIIIDMLYDFVDSEGRLYCGPEGSAIVPRVKSLLEQAREQGIPVVFIADRHLPSDPEFDIFPPHCVQDSPGAEIIEALRPLGDERVIAKRRYSAFFGTDLDLTLRELRADELILVGVCTNICVLYTAADARNLAYRVVVPADAVASFDASAHDWALGQMETVLGCQVPQEGYLLCK